MRRRSHSLASPSVRRKSCHWELPAQEKSGKERAGGLEQGPEERKSSGKSLQRREIGESAQAHSAWRWPTHRDILLVGEVPAAQEKSGKRCASAVEPMSPPDAQLSRLEAIFFFSLQDGKAKIVAKY